MANPYKKAEQVQKKAPGSRQETIKHEPITTPIVIPEIKEEKAVEDVTPAVKAPVEQPVKEVSVKEDLLSGMVEARPRGKSYGFYLDDEVVAALDKLAKQKKSNKSKVLNTLLRKILLD